MELDIARQKRTRRIAAHGAHHRVEALNGVVGEGNRPSTARKRRDRTNLAVAMLNDASFLHAQTQHVENRRSLVAVRVNAALVFFKREHTQIFKERHNRFGRKHVHGLLHEFGVVIIGAHDVGVAHIAPAIARYEQLLSNAIGALEHMGLSAFSSCRNGARHARRAATDDCHFRHTLTSLHSIRARVDDLARFD